MAANAVNYCLDRRELTRLLPEAQARGTFLRALGANVGSCFSPRQVRQGLSALGFAPTPQVLAFINLKGGVGKTTSAVTLASRAAQLGWRTCLVDLDSQASASLALGVEVDESSPVFYDVWSKPEEMVAGSLVRVQEFLHLLPSSLENGLLDSNLSQPASLKKAAAGVCQQLMAQGFDLVVLDCPPSLGPAVITAVCAAQTIVIPMGCDAFSLRGMRLTLEEVASIRETFGLPRPQVRILLTGVDRRIKLWKQAWQHLQSHHAQELLPVMIRTSSEFTKALGSRRTVFASAAASPARDDYDRFTRLVLGLTGVLSPEGVHG